jgi:hypothetical protein
MGGAKSPRDANTGRDERAVRRDDRTWRRDDR